MFAWLFCVLIWGGIVFIALRTVYQLIRITFADDPVAYSNSCDDTKYLKY